MIKFLWLLLKWGLLLALVGAFSIFVFIKFHPAFGARPDAHTLARMRKNPQFDGRIFHNLEPTQIGVRDGDHAEKPNLFHWIMEVTQPPPGKHPAAPLVVKPLDEAAFFSGDRAVWLGHSTVLLHWGGKTLLTDPVFHRASPVPIGGAPFPMTNAPTAAAMPKLDAVVISHDHYDHLDYKAIRELDGKTAHFYVPLGVKAHLQRWGVAAEKISELDWHEQVQADTLTLTLVPTRHYGGRNLTNRGTTLWGAWVIDSGTRRVYFNGDSGYGKHFVANGERYGPFDLVLMENGAYDPKWPQIHMTPEESVQAALDLRAAVVMPMHWGKFDLAYHPWKEPIERFTRAAQGKNLIVATPRLGEVFSPESPPQNYWWEALD